MDDKIGQIWQVVLAEVASTAWCKFLHGSVNARAVWCKYLSAIATLSLGFDRVGSADVDPEQIGYLRGVLAHVSLVAGAEVIAQETRAAMSVQLRLVASHTQTWTQLVDEVVKGSREAKDAAVVGAVFRPNFHARKADEHLAAERWTEATLRYVQAGETLIRDVISALLEERLGVELSYAEKTTHWRKTAQGLLSQAGFHAEAEPAWVEYSEVYQQRNTRFAHGHEEASMEDAVRSRSAWTSISELMRDAFAATTGTTLDDLQRAAIADGAANLSDQDSQALVDCVLQAERTRKEGSTKLARFVQSHRLTQPKEVGDFYLRLGNGDREIADVAFVEAAVEALERVKHVWSTTTDIDSVLVEAALGVSTGAQHDAAVQALRPSN